METSEETRNQTQEAAEQQSLTPASRSEDEDALSCRTVQLPSSRTVPLSPAQTRPQRTGLQGSWILQNRAQDHSSAGQQAMRTGQYEEAVTCFSRAVTLQPEQSRLHVGRAEAFLQLCDFLSAAACYRRALLLEGGAYRGRGLQRAGPTEGGAYRGRLAFIYRLQGQCLFDGGFFLEALEVFRTAAELDPQSCRAAEVRSLACLAAAGRHGDCLKMVSDWMASDVPTAALHVLRGRLYKQMNQTSRCYQDVRSALALDPACRPAAALLLQLQAASDRARAMAVTRALCGELPEALCMVNVALENCPRDGRLYLFRGTLYRHLKDFTTAIEDLVQAAELSEEEEVRGQEEVKDEEAGAVQKEAELQLVLTYNDFAVQCFSRGQYAEATLLLTKAMEEQREEAGLYLNRGDCFFKQGDWCFALADYQQAEEMMRPGDPAVRLRLAVVHNTLGSVCFQDGCFQEAAHMFSLAVQYEPSARRYHQNRAKAHRRLGDLKAAREDFICMLILDPAHQEVPPMLMSVFPGCSASDVLSSPEGQTVRAQLMETIQACSSSSGPQRLSEKLQQTTLTAEKMTSRSGEPGEPGEPGEELQLMDLQRMLKNLLQVQDLVQDLVQDRPTHPTHLTSDDLKGSL